MARTQIDDALWEIIEPLIPVRPRRKTHPGRRPIDNRACLEGIIFVLRTGIPWEDLPAQFGCSGMTCWRRLRDWNNAGVWRQLHLTLLRKLRAADRIDFTRALVDSGTVRAVGGASGPARTPRTGGNPARNATCSWTAAACRSSCT